jgi:hypothetical protein
MGRRLWPSTPTEKEVEPISEDVKKKVTEDEQLLRAELVRVQSEARRFKLMSERHE